MKRRLIISHAFPQYVSGAERAICDMVDNAPEDFSISMLVPGDAELAAFYRTKEYEVRCVQLSPNRRLYPWRSWVDAYSLAKFLKLQYNDIVLSNTFAAAQRHEKLARISGCRHAIYVREYIRNIRARRTILERANLVLAVSNDVLSNVRNVAPNAKVHVCIDDFKPLSLPENPPGIKYDSLFVGRITRYKRPDLFTKAIAEVKVAFPSISAALVGSASDAERAYEEYCHQLIKDLRLDANISVLGVRDDVPSLLCASGSVCMISDREPYPRIILEAQSIGCPVIATNSGGVPEMVTDKVDAILIDPEPASEVVRQLANAIITLINDKDAGRRLSQNARRKIFRDSDGHTASRRFYDTLRALNP